MKPIPFLLALVPCLLFAIPEQHKGIEDAKTYHANSGLQWNIAMETIDLLPWIESENILDVGCGDGKITALLSKKVPSGSVLGIDISQSMIDFASSHYPQTSYPNLTFQKGDGAEISFENQFDRIVSFSTLHWVLDQAKILNAFYRALVPNGKLCIHTYGKGNMNISDILADTEKYKPYFVEHLQQRVFFTEEEYRLLLEQAGFQDIQIIGSWSTTTFANRQAVIDFTKPLLNSIRHLSQDLQQEITEELVDRLMVLAGSSPDGSILYRTFNLQVTATK